MADFTGKPLSDKEIRDLIIRGSLADFNRGQCYQKTEIPAETPPPPPSEGNTTETETRSLTTSRWGGTQYNIQSSNQIQKPNVIATPSPTLKCMCPCPYSMDNKNQECGSNSAYFHYPAQYKPKCYVEDIKDWEVTDFRLKNEIRTPDESETKPAPR